jgi:hypothetical protein
MANKKDLAFEHFMRVENPAPKKRRKSVSAKSQISGKTPTARLKKRRLKNTEPGYFPNPILHDMSILDDEIISAIRGAKNLKTVRERQASASYAQGFIQGLFYSNVIDSKAQTKYITLLKESLK